MTDKATEVVARALAGPNRQVHIEEGEEFIRALSAAGYAVVPVEPTDMPNPLDESILKAAEEKGLAIYYGLNMLHGMSDRDKLRKAIREGVMEAWKVAGE